MIKNIFRWYRRYYSIEQRYYRALKFWKMGGVYKYLSIYITNRINRNYSCYLSPKATVGERLSLRHPVGIVIGDGVHLGNDVCLYQSVTLGAVRSGEGEKNLYPTISDNVVIFAGACVLGSVKLSEGVTVGANAVLLTDAEKNSVYVGIPAKKIK